MRTQEQALRIYYAAMLDAELQSAVVNKDSFLPLAQRLLTEELQRRHLPGAPLRPPPLPPLPEPGRGVMRVLRHAWPALK